MQAELFTPLPIQCPPGVTTPFDFAYGRKPGGWLKALSAKEELVANTDAEAVEHARSLLRAATTPVGDGVTIPAYPVSLIHRPTGRPIPLPADLWQQSPPAGSAD